MLNIKLTLLKKVSEAYARVAAIRIELHKATKAYAKVAKSSIELPEVDRLCCFKFDDAVELHKSHKISDARVYMSQYTECFTTLRHNCRR